MSGGKEAPPEEKSRAPGKITRREIIAIIIVLGIPAAVIAFGLFINFMGFMSHL